MARKMSSDTREAAEKLMPTLGWYLSPNQMIRLAELLGEDNPKCGRAGQAVYCKIAELLGEFNAY